MSLSTGKVKLYFKKKNGHEFTVKAHPDGRENLLNYYTGIRGMTYVKEEAIEEEVPNPYQAGK